MLLREIREMGLYVDEQRDFQEEMEFMRHAKGKGKPFKKLEETPMGKQGRKPRGEGVTWHRNTEE